MPRDSLRRETRLMFQVGAFRTARRSTPVGAFRHLGCSDDQQPPVRKKVDIPLSSGGRIRGGRGSGHPAGGRRTRTQGRCRLPQATGRRRCRNMRRTCRRTFVTLRSSRTSSVRHASQVAPIVGSGVAGPGGPATQVVRPNRHFGDASPLVAAEPWAWALGDRRMCKCARSAVMGALSPALCELGGVGGRQPCGRRSRCCLRAALQVSAPSPRRRSCVAARTSPWPSPWDRGPVFGEEAPLRQPT